jgi:tRNA threonylcarbamoyladenosine biosynthesis protein TsaE
LKQKIEKKESYHIKNIEDLDAFCRDLSKKIGSQGIVMLDGPLGAGKTKLVERFVVWLGGHGVSSPTFTLHQNYKTRTHAVDHFDLYRIESADDLESTGFWDVFQDANKIIFIEWAEKININQLPEGWLVAQVHIDFVGANSQSDVNSNNTERKIQVSYYS